VPRPLFNKLELLAMNVTTSTMRILAFTLPLLLEVGTPPAMATSCAAEIGSCEYYQCLEDEVRTCGLNGYALGYVKPYCEKFVAIDFPEVDSAWSEEIFPDDANPWRDNVLNCLQVSMEDFLDKNESASCDAVRNFGFASHPICYTSGPSFCAITPQNVFRVGLAIGPSILRPMFFQQVRATAGICVDQLDARIAADERPWVRNQLGAYRRLWQAVAIDPSQIASPARPE
jgi:hypothetical protein